MLETGWYENQGVIGDDWFLIGEGDPVEQGNIHSDLLRAKPPGLRVLLTANVLSSRWPTDIIDQFKYGASAVGYARMWCIKFFQTIRRNNIIPDGLFADDESTPVFWSIANMFTTVDQVAAYMDKLLQDPFAVRVLPPQMRTLKGTDFTDGGWWVLGSHANSNMNAFNVAATRWFMQQMDYVLFDPFNTVFTGSFFGNWDVVNLNRSFVDRNGYPMADVPGITSMPAIYLWSDGKLFQGGDKHPIWNAGIWALNYLKSVDPALSVPWFSYLGFAGDSVTDPKVKQAAQTIELFLLNAANRLRFKRIGLWNPSNSLPSTPSADQIVVDILATQPTYKSVPTSSRVLTPFNVDILQVDNVSLPYEAVRTILGV